MQAPEHVLRPQLVPGISTLLIGLACAPLVHAAPECLVPTGPYLRTQVPWTYALDRRDPYAPDYLESYTDSVPTVIETGLLTPGHPYFGPLCDLEALRAGRPERGVEDFVRQYRENRQKAQEFTPRARAAGADQVLTYICMMTTGGDPEKRTGFWRFYDHWDAFAEFNIPARPDTDPETWQQRKPDGTPVIAYRREHPPYRPMFRWTNCINNPGWRAYQRWVTEEAARVGVDGFFVDNAGTMKCTCSICRELFATWLRSRYTGADIAELFQGDLSMAAEGDKDTPLRKAEVQLFWQESIHRFLSDIRTWGARIRGQFFVFPNGLHRRSHFIATRFRDCDLAMDENSSGDMGGNPGVVTRHVIAGMHVKDVNEHLLAYRYASGTGARCRLNMYSYEGYPKHDPGRLGANANVYALGIAEAAAFGGGGCYAPTRQRPEFSPVRAAYNRFFSENADLYRGKLPYSQVGIIGFVLPNYYGDRATYSGVDQCLQTLMAGHVLSDIVPERVFTDEWIARYPALVVPYCAIMSASQMATLVAYARKGGKLILLGATTAARDRFGRQRDPNERKPLLEAAQLCLDSDLGAALADGAPIAAFGLCPENVAPLVRFAAYVDDPREPTELILHCVNYDVDLGTDHDRVGTVHDLALSIPLPVGRSAVRAVLETPGCTAQPLAVSSRNGRAELTVPQLRIYSVVHLSLGTG